MACSVLLAHTEQLNIRPVDICDRQNMCEYSQCGCVCVYHVWIVIFICRHSISIEYYISKQHFAPTRHIPILNETRRHDMAEYDSYLHLRNGRNTVECTHCSTTESPLPRRHKLFWTFLSFCLVQQCMKSFMLIMLCNTMLQKIWIFRKRLYSPPLQYNDVLRRRRKMFDVLGYVE